VQALFRSDPDIRVLIATDAAGEGVNLQCANQGDKFVLAIVLVKEDDSHEGPYYVRRPFDREPDWGVSSLNYNLSDLFARSTRGS
jgi:hypothetical protein